MCEPDVSIAFNIQCVPFAVIINGIFETVNDTAKLERAK